MKSLTLPLFNGWSEDNLEPNDWSNPKRYNNYVATTVMDGDGKEQRVYLDESKESDLYFNFSKANVGDIIIASCWDERKYRQSKRYYIVEAKDEKEIVLAYADDEGNIFTTYRKAAKAKLN